MAFFKVTYAEKNRTAYVWNSGCNFACKGCYYKLKPELNAADEMPGTDEIKNALLRLSRKNGGVESVHFLGGEPTISQDLRELAGFSRDVLHAKTHLVTNGSNTIDSSLFDSASVSIKAPSRKRYDKYTGTDKYDVLGNVIGAHRSGVKLSLSSVLIPGYVGPKDIETIAEQIATTMDPGIQYHIIGYMPVPGAPWRKAAPEEVADASTLAKKHLKQVTSSCPEPEDFEYKSVRVL